jgi:hypothetical protein
MSISITFSFSNGGLGIADPVDHGDIANGSTTTPQTIYISHNGINPITSAGLYCSSVNSSEYAGSATALTDLEELIAWGNALTSNDFGGVQFNLNATGSFPGSSWPTFTNKTTVDSRGYTVRSGVGDSSSNTILIPSSAGASSLGTIPVGSSPNVRFQSRIVAPVNEDQLGIRQFKLSLNYNFTS